MLVRQFLRDQGRGRIDQAEARGEAAENQVEVKTECSRPKQGSQKTMLMMKRVILIIN